MKKIIFFASVLLLALNCSATIHRVNNNAGVTGVFTTLQLAVNAANAGDTIYIEPSKTVYSLSTTIVINKKLAIFSNGSELENYTNLQAKDETARLGGQLLFKPAAGGSYISITTTNSVFVDSASNITFDNCFFGNSLFLINCSNMLVTRSIIKGSGSAFGTQISSSSNEILFKNCFLGTRQVLQPSSTNIKFVHCNFNNASTSTFYNSLFISCIFATQSQIHDFDSSCVFQNNVFNILGGYNIASNSFESKFLDLNDVFQNGNAVTQDPSSQQLLPNFEPKDMGAFAGETPFKLGTQPTIPSIYQLDINTFVTTPDLKINLSTRSNK